jgi:hypothetical protein
MKQAEKNKQCANDHGCPLKLADSAINILAHPARAGGITWRRSISSPVDRVANFAIMSHRAFSPSPIHPTL